MLPSAHAHEMWRRPFCVSEERSQPSASALACDLEVTARRIGLRRGNERIGAESCPRRFEDGAGTMCSPYKRRRQETKSRRLEGSLTCRSHLEL